jgi:hypothetical protein
MEISKLLQVRESPNRGRGVFALKKIKANTVIEISPVLVFTKKEAVLAEKTLLYNYFFEWGEDYKKRALGLGYISIYNHSHTNNCAYEMNYNDNTIAVYTLRDIKVNEELFINYLGDEPDLNAKIWFKLK